MRIQGIQKLEMSTDVFIKLFMCRSYCKNWQPLIDCTDKNDIMSEYQYRTQEEREAMADKGDFTLFKGGGYELQLRGHIDALNDKIKTLQLNDWIDNRTRALVTEFSVYNAQVNKFGVVKIVAEQIGGGFLPYYRIDVISLTRQKNLKGYILWFCEVAFILSTLYYIVNSLAILKELGAKEFFQQAWNVADVFTICLSLVAIGLYVLKTWVVLKLLKKISETRGNEYLSIDDAKSVNAQYELVVSITVFCSLLKLCKLLR